VLLGSYDWVYISRHEADGRMLEGTVVPRSSAVPLLKHLHDDGTT
jgi:hypothetical protein